MLQNQRVSARRASRRSANRARRTSRNGGAHGAGRFGNDVRGYAGIMPEVHAEPALLEEVPLTFYCQLAQGGPTAVIPRPNNLSEVYQEIATKFDGLTADDILYCTVNTFKPDMEALLTSNLKLNDFIFAHVRGTRKEVTLTKTDAMLGVTLSDNGFGKVFIKRLHPKSIAARSQPAVLVGDHIEKVNGENVVGQRHFSVAAMLRAIPVGANFTLRLIEPQKTGFSFIAPRSTNAAAAKPQKPVEDGNQTLRFRSTGDAVMQEAPSKVVIDKINNIFETYLGFNDDVLALAGWEIAMSSANYVELRTKFNESDLGGFGFPDELLFDIWGIVDDFRNQRLTGVNAPACNIAVHVPNQIGPIIEEPQDDASVTEATTTEPATTSAAPNAANMADTDLD
uniref:PDZ domain-containing protein n=1 Tax=Panagrellus redivivus TaxID=6233 RepID=A0A7E4VHD0_PANRE